jgi:hypothetical protein
MAEHTTASASLSTKNYQLSTNNCPVGLLSSLTPLQPTHTLRDSSKLNRWITVGS